MPAAEVHYRRSANTEAMLAWHTERAMESLRAAGAVAVEAVTHPANGHLMGTARMGVDPARSVVDPWGRCHDVPNLVIVDGSVFVTAGSANPTSTIAALALRLPPITSCATAATFLVRPITDPSCHLTGEPRGRPCRRRLAPPPPPPSRPST